MEHSAEKVFQILPVTTWNQYLVQRKYCLIGHALWYLQNLQHPTDSYCKQNMLNF